MLVGVYRLTVLGLSTQHLFAGYRQNGVHHFGERRVFWGTSHADIISLEFAHIFVEPSQMRIRHVNYRFKHE